MENIIGYIRVSTGDQENSLELQEKAIRQYCSFRELNLTEIFIDQDVSGFKQFESREGGKNLSAKLNLTKNIVAVKPDRLFRNTIDGLTTVDKWNDKGISLHIVDMGGVALNTKTAIGRLLFTTLISFSQFERDITGERVKSILNDKKSSKKIYCSDVFGFDKNNGELIPNPAEQQILSEIKRLTETGKGPSFIARYLNSNNHKSKTGGKFYQSTINYIVKNSLYN